MRVEDLGDSIEATKDVEAKQDEKGTKDPIKRLRAREQQLSWSLPPLCGHCGPWGTQS